MMYSQYRLTKKNVCFNYCVTVFLAGTWQMRKYSKSTKMTIFCCTFQYALGLQSFQTLGYTLYVCGNIQYS